MKLLGNKAMQRVKKMSCGQSRIFSYEGVVFLYDAIMDFYTLEHEGIHGLIIIYSNKMQCRGTTIINNNYAEIETLIQYVIEAIQTTPRFSKKQEEMINAAIARYNTLKSSDINRKFYEMCQGIVGVREIKDEIKHIEFGDHFRSDTMSRTIKF